MGTTRLEQRRPDADHGGVRLGAIGRRHDEARARGDGREHLVELALGHQAGPEPVFRARRLPARLQVGDGLGQPAEVQIAAAERQEADLDVRAQLHGLPGYYSGRSGGGVGARGRVSGWSAST